MEDEKEETVFKVPKISIGPRPGAKKSVKCVDTEISKNDDVPITVITNEAVNTNDSDNVEEKIDPPKKIIKTSQVPIPYEEPSWGGKPGDKYFLEV